MKSRIYNSRVNTTVHVVESMREGSVLVSTSAVGYYGDAGDQLLRENSPPGQDFLARVCVEWERAAWEAAKRGVRVVILRFGIVLGKTGGALAPMMKTFSLGVGGPLGSGRQWFSWIHMADLLRIMEFVVEQGKLQGVFNACAPQPVRNRELATALGNILKKPSFFPTPAIMLKLLLGEFGSVLLSSQRVVPERLLNEGFQFLYPSIEAALATLLR